jgi:hypothetical protein
VDGAWWPKAAELVGASSQQLSGVHQTCCQRGRNVSPWPRTGHHCVVEPTLRCDFLSIKCAAIEVQSLSYVTRGRSLRSGRLGNDTFQPRDVFQEAPTRQDEEVIAELRVLKVDFK